MGDHLRAGKPSQYVTSQEGKCCDEVEAVPHSVQAPPCTDCGHQGVVHRQLQKTEAPDRLTGIASLTKDQSDADT